jgi:hypothetical protein
MLRKDGPGANGAGKLTPERLEEIRRRWENSKSETLKNLAKEFGCTENALKYHKKRQGWQKVPDLMQVVREAQGANSADAFKNPILEVSDKPAPSASKPDPAALRAAVIERHQRELQGARALLYEAIKGKNHEKAKLAKTAAEAVKIIQQAERDAYGLDKEPEKDPSDPESNKIVIERE